MTTIEVAHRQRFDWMCQSCMTGQSDTVNSDRAIELIPLECTLCEETWQMKIEPGILHTDIITIRVVG